ncbi:MAG: Spy/CpxP family protein refolding chaperone [Rhizomicrobium sp.]
MRKALIPMLASLVLCGAATVTLVATTAGAQTNTRKPVMVALVAPGTMLAQNDPAPPGNRDMRMPSPAEMTAQFKQMCEDHYAREAGRMAYLEARLNLTSSEQSLFTRWKTVKLDIAKRDAADCGQHMSRPDRKISTPVERMSREQDMLKKRLADLDAERPVLAALYDALTPKQREALSGGNRMMARGGMMDRGMMRRGPMEMGDRPPAPPPQ